MSSRWRVNAVQLARDPVAGRLCVPKWLAAYRHTKTRDSNLANVNDHRAVGSLSGVMSSADLHKKKTPQLKSHYFKFNIFIPLKKKKVKMPT